MEVEKEKQEMRQQFRLALHYHNVKYYTEEKDLKSGKELPRESETCWAEMADSDAPIQRARES